MTTPATPDGLPTAADLDAVAAELEQKAQTLHQQADAMKIEESAQPHPQATPPATPEPDAQTSAPGAAPAPIELPPSHATPVHGGPTNPSLDTREFDDLGNKKGDARQFGPVGDNVPADVQDIDTRQAAADAGDQKRAQLNASTAAIDSAGKPKGAFEVLPGGKGQFGEKLPDVVDYSKPVEAPPAHVGPRGVGAPQDSFHGPRPKKN